MAVSPCLLGVLLVARFDSDPQIIFHYPPHPGEDDSMYSKYFSRSYGDGTTSSSEDESTSSSEDESRLPLPNPETKEDNKQDPVIDETGSASPEKQDGMTTPQRHTRWDDLLGYKSALLAKVLCPPASGHKKKFEIALDDKVFLGRPVFAKDGGGWRRRKRMRTRISNGSIGEVFDGISSNPDPSVVEDSDLSVQEADNSIESDSMARSAVTSTPDNTGGDLVEAHDLGNEDFKPNTEDDLSMFHAVFIMDPPPLEYHLRIKEMYDHVARKLSKALKLEQARSSYVSKEATAISSSTKRYFKVNASSAGSTPSLAPLYHELLSQSSLARGLANVYSNISLSQIAHVTLTPRLSLSLQIPIPSSISILPSLIDPPLPGLWLTTATSIPVDDDAHMDTSQLASHFGLLLLSDLHSILADVNSTDSPLTEPLLHYLRVTKPTKSFYQISQSSGIPISDIQFLASHLIYWRRARAIPPLHQRDVYIVSPNADMTKFATATSTSAKLYPTLPALPKIMGMLSSTTRPYSTLIPSKDHKEAYMEILAWLFRGGWVTQLRAFAWIRVPPHIMRMVEKQAVTEDQKPKSITTDNSLDVPHLGSSPASSTHSSTHTTLPIRPSSPLPEPALITQPSHSDSVSSQRLSAISKHVLEKQGEEAQKAWQDCIKYFDGKHALETIAVREGWKRKRVGELIAGWENLGVLRRVRHW